MAAEPQKQALGQPEREVRQARGQGQNDERNDESANTDESADRSENETARETISRATDPELTYLIADLLQ